MSGVGMPAWAPEASPETDPIGREHATLVGFSFAIAARRYGNQRVRIVTKLGDGHIGRMAGFHLADRTIPASYFRPIRPPLGFSTLE